jgi:hypothetical protein
LKSSDEIKIPSGVVILEFTARAKNSRSNEFLKIHLCRGCVQPNTEVLLAKKGGETDEHCKIFYISGFGRCGDWRFCLC